MAQMNWERKRLSVRSLLPDERNPRLGNGSGNRSPREIIQYLFHHDSALEVSESIARYGYFESEPLLAIRSGRHFIVVEGNRRLAGLKALLDPHLLTGPHRRKIEALHKLADLESISRVPVTIAPSRRATDPIVAVRHVGTPVRAWVAANRANFVLDKLDEGYTNKELHDELGFSETDIQSARRTRAVSEMTHALDVPDAVKEKIDSPRVKLFSTLERVVDSSVGREYLKLEPDANHGLRGLTTIDEFKRAFAQLVSDIALQKETSRSLNKNDDIRDYFEQRNPSAVAKAKQGSFVPHDIISGRTVSAPKPPKPVVRTRRQNPSIIPSSLKVKHGHERLVDIRGELIKLKRSSHPNAGAVLLRVFLEIAIKDYLDRTGRLQRLIGELKSKGKLPKYGVPPMRQLSAEIVKVAKDQLDPSDATMVEKALRYDPAAPFSVNDLHAFVHLTDFPGENDIRQFWNRTEPLFRLMLEEEPKASQP